jgi:hypothetical protein
MTLRLFRTPAAFVFGTAAARKFHSGANASRRAESPYGGTTVEEIIARVNDQIITRSDYDRAMKELDAEARQHGASMQEISEAHKDLLRNLIDQQLWLSKGKELGITGETELIKRLDEIRKQYNLETMEDLEKAAKEQGVSFEDFKANIRNGIITQEVMREEVGKQDSVHARRGRALLRAAQAGVCAAGERDLSEILVSPARPPLASRAAAQPDDPANWPRPRPRPTTSRPNSMRAATSANWRELQRRSHGGRGRRSGPVQARSWPRSRGSDLCAQGGQLPSRFAPSRASSSSRWCSTSPAAFRRSRTSRSRWKRTST